MWRPRNLPQALHPEFKMKQESRGAVPRINFSNYSTEIPPWKLNDILDSKIQDEVLKSRIRRFIDEKPASRFFHRLSTNPLVSVITAFILTGLLGGFLTNYYNSKQKELEAQKINE
jgi:hypothetical protein